MDCDLQTSQSCKLAAREAPGFNCQVFNDLISHAAEAATLPVKMLPGVGKFFMVRTALLLSHSEGLAAEINRHSYKGIRSGANWHLWEETTAAKMGGERVAVGTKH